MSSFKRFCGIAAIKLAPNRQRREFDPKALNELKESILQHGLFHAIVIREEGDDLILVSGERRLRAITDIYDLGGVFKFDGFEVTTGLIPYTTLGDLDPIAREEAELSENIHRSDLTWQERAQATARIAALRTAQAERTGAPPPAVRAIAEEVRGSSEGIHHENTRREILVARHLDKPEVAKAQSLADAFKALKKAEAREKHAQLAETIGATYTSDIHRLHNDDSLHWMVEQPPEKFDVILTDPPYGMGADEFGDSGGRAEGQHRYEDDDSTFFKILEACSREFYRLAKPMAHLYWFCDIDKFHLSRSAFEKAGWWVHRTPLIWYKPTANRVPWPQHGPQRKYELILYAVKGKRPVNIIAPDVLEYRPDDNLGHNAQKPIDLFANLLGRSCRPGDTVLDPFCGTGTVFVAANQLRLAATGIELDPIPYGIAAIRLDRLKETVNGTEAKGDTSNLEGL